MARFEHLPLYNKNYELLKACFRVLEKMPRGHSKSYSGLSTTRLLDQYKSAGMGVIVYPILVSR